MLSGGQSQFVALKAAMPWLDINQERHHAYMGYVGMVKLVEEIDKALFNPVWEQLRTARAVGQAGEELAGQGDGADGGRGRRACRRSRASRDSPPRQEDLQLQERRSRHDRGCDPRACA